MAWSGPIQQAAGLIIVLLILLDVFLTVLYARMGTGVLSRPVARLVWVCFRAIAGLWRSRSGEILSFCGPAILVMLLLTWAGGLTLGSALILHPALGSGVQASNGKTPTDFITALYAAGTSVSIVGGGDFGPRTRIYRLIYLFNSLAGVSVTSLTLTYLMQIYTTVQQRNAFALKVYVGTGQTGDASRLLAGNGPLGRWDLGASVWSEFAGELVSTKEAHHSYPVLFYMRFPKPFYSVSFVCSVLLDTVTLLRAGASSRYEEIKRFGGVDDVWHGALLLVVSLEETFLPQGPADRAAPDEEELERWRVRFRHGLRHLREAGIETVSDDDIDAVKRYVELRRQWNDHIRRLAPQMMYSMEEIDPATENACRQDAGAAEPGADHRRAA